MSNVVGISETRKTIELQDKVIKEQEKVLKLQDMRINQLVDKIKRMEREGTVINMGTNKGGL